MKRMLRKVDRSAPRGAAQPAHRGRLPGDVGPLEITRVEHRLIDIKLLQPSPKQRDVDRAFFNLSRNEPVHAQPANRSGSTTTCAAPAELLATTAKRQVPIRAIRDTLFGLSQTLDPLFRGC